MCRKRETFAVLAWTLPPSFPAPLCTLCRLKSCLIRQTVAHMSVSRVTLNVRQTKGLSYLKSSWIKAFFPPINFDSPPKWKVWSDRGKGKKRERERLWHRLQADGHVLCCLLLLPRDYTWKKNNYANPNSRWNFFALCGWPLDVKVKSWG